MTMRAAMVALFLAGCGGASPEMVTESNAKLAEFGESCTTSADCAPTDSGTVVCARANFASAGQGSCVFTVSIRRQENGDDSWLVYPGGSCSYASGREVLCNSWRHAM